MWRPRKVSQGTTAREDNSPAEGQWEERNGENRERVVERPTIITVEMNGRERSWGPLSRRAALRVGCFLEDMDREVNVFIEKEGERREVGVEKLVK